MQCPTCKREGYTPKGVYPCGEHSAGTLGIHWKLTPQRGCENGFVKSGERRAPRKGEWYLSGAIPAAYQAKADLDTAYIIMLPFIP